MLKIHIFACNRKFTFYPLQIHKQVVHYHQSKDIDEQTPNITSHPIPIKSLYLNREGLLIFGFASWFKKQKLL